jgi:CelD/BcsL family acetyltransferase involved in cellulose biosynthesis
VVRCETVLDLPSLERLQPEWDALAVASSLPMASPGWMLPWWRHLAPAGAELRVVTVHDRERLVGIAPFFLAPPLRREPRTYRLLAAEVSTSVAPLAAPGREWEVAGAIAETLAEPEHRPDLLALEPMPLASPWLMALRERWPGAVRPWGWRYDVQSAPIVSLHDESFDAWLATRSAKFRTSMRRLQRLFDAAGGAMRLSTSETLAQDLEAFQRLHAARWAGLGQSRFVALGEPFAEMLRDAGSALLAIGDPASDAGSALLAAGDPISDAGSALPATGDPASDAGEPRAHSRQAAGLASKPASGPRFQLRLLEIAGEAICADVSIVGGGEIVGFNNGWDERFKRMSPPLLAFMYDVEEGFARGYRRLQLGWGGNMYKQRFANGDDPVAWSLLLMPGARAPLTLARAGPLLAASWLRASAKRMLTPRQLERLRPLAARLPR